METLIVTVRCLIRYPGSNLKEWWQVYINESTQHLEDLLNKFNKNSLLVQCTQTVFFFITNHSQERYMQFKFRIILIEDHQSGIPIIF